MRAGDTLQGALENGLKDLDGFYTFVVGTRDGFAVIRDPIACKPAVIAETDDWVAMASEYRAIAPLPGAEQREDLGARARDRLCLEPGRVMAPRRRSRTRRAIRLDLAADDAARGEPAAARQPGAAISSSAIRAARMRSPAGSTAISTSRSTAMSATTAPA